MAKLDSLKITESPYAFASFAAKHNALVDLIAGMVGQNGITVTIAEKNAIIRGNIANGGGGGTISGNVTQVVTSTGSLANAYFANTNTNAFPSAGKWVTALGNVTIDGTSGLVSNVAARFAFAGGNVFANSTGLSIVRSNGVSCNIAFAAISRNLTIRSLGICSNGTMQNIDIIASAAY